ncbi:MAG: glycosyl transferase [Candidatus Aureabacteria bacterium]|nr:glycosyl transferase [Candidatus Auribacterota bacterium]
MQFGFFDDKNREYVITRPDTPAPWINYLGASDYCAIISNNAGGYSFSQSPKSGRILRFRFNNIPEDRPGRYIYIRDRKDGDYWSVSWQPVAKPLREFKTECRHGLGYTKISSFYRGIGAQVTYFVPEKKRCEVWALEIENKSDKRRELDIFSYAEFCLWNSELDMKDYQYILYTAKTCFRGGLIDYRLQFGDGSLKKAFFGSTGKTEGFDSVRESFVGQYRSEKNPVAVEKGYCLSSSQEGGNPCGSLQVRMTLEPGESKRVNFVMGEVNSPGDGSRAIRYFKKKNSVEKELEKISKLWSKKLSAMQCSTGIKAFDTMFNIWNQYQCHTTFSWSRSASYIEAGGRDGLGYRDSLQDILGVVHSIPERVRARLVELLKAQTSKGCAFHHIQPLTMKTGGGSFPDRGAIYSDDHLWLGIAVGAYVKETGDRKFLFQNIPYIDKGAASVYSHLLKSVDFSLNNLGPRGLCLGLAADWNDCINLYGKGQSVWSSMLLVRSLDEIIQLAGYAGKKADAMKLKKLKRKISDRINRVAWDGKWYLRAYVDSGRKVGSSSCREGKIFVNPQSWAVMSGVAEPGKARLCLASVSRYLNTKFGIRLLAPAYAKYDREIGSITSFPKGLKENAGIFCHANPWVVIAECIMKNPERAFKYCYNILPGAYNSDSDKRKAEPYVYSQFTTGKENGNFGQTKNPWLTGTAAWCFIASAAYILGVRPDFDGLVVDPCIPLKMKKVNVKRYFRGALYDIHVERRKGLTSSRTLLNGSELKGIKIPLQKKGSKNKVFVFLPS